MINSTEKNLLAEMIVIEEMSMIVMKEMIVKEETLILISLKEIDF